MSINRSIIATTGVELTLSASAHVAYTAFSGPLTHPPIHIIFDNQSDQSYTISIDGTNTWRTFPAGEAVLLDMRANHGIADNMTFRQGTQFYGINTAGSGQFSISYTYAVV